MTLLFFNTIDDTYPLLFLFDDCDNYDRYVLLLLFYLIPFGFNEICDDIYLKINQLSLLFLFNFTFILYLLINTIYK